MVLDVGVLSLPLVKGKGGVAEGSKGVLGLGGSGLLAIIGRGRLGSGLLLGRGLLLGLLRLLGGNVGESGGLEELELLSNGGEDGLVADSVKPASDVGVRLTVSLVEEVLETTLGNTGGEEISQGDTLTNQVGVVGEVLLNNGEGLEGSLRGVLDVSLVVRGTAQKGAEPVAQAGEDLSVEVREPLQDGGIAN